MNSTRASDDAEENQGNAEVDNCSPASDHGPILTQYTSSNSSSSGVQKTADLTKAVVSATMLDFFGKISALLETSVSMALNLYKRMTLILLTSSR